MSEEGYRTPWQILGIPDSLSATKSDVKKAYARLIKKHGPDSDPVTFQRIHQAYQQALAQLVEDSVPAGLLVPAVSNPVSESADEGDHGLRETSIPFVSVAFSDAETALRNALEADDQNKVGAALESFRPIMKENAEAWKPWGRLMADAFGTKVSLLSTLLPAAGVMRLIETEQTDLAEAVMVEWKSKSAHEKLADLAGSVLARGAHLSQPAQFLASGRLALLLAFHRPQLGEKIANALFQQIPPGSGRDHVLSRIEQRLMLGRVFGALGPSQASFWESRLTGESDPKAADWKKP